MLRVGLISDTHGLLRPEAMAFLRGSDVIVHAGDIGNAAVLTELAAIAPVTAVRGNNDKGPWAETVRETEVLQVGQVDRKSTRLNSSHANISYAVFCLKKKK